MLDEWPVGNRCSGTRYGRPWMPPRSLASFCSPVRRYRRRVLAVAALGGSPERLLRHLDWLGLLFESLVIRDLWVLDQALDGAPMASAWCRWGRWGLESAVAHRWRQR